MAQRNLLLISSSYAGGGDYLGHCWGALKKLYGNLDGGHVLFIPYANAYDWQSFARECMPHFERNGIKIKSILDYERPQDALSDQNLAGIFMAGGNTFKLMKWLYDYELIVPIRQRANEGLPYAGASAGIVVACPGIYTTNDMPMIEPKGFKALNLIPFQINPHFVSGELISGHHGETREQRIQQFHTAHKVPVASLREGGWLEVHGNSVTLGGQDEAVLFEASGRSESLKPGVMSNDTCSRFFSLSYSDSKLG